MVRNSLIFSLEWSLVFGTILEIRQTVPNSCPFFKTLKWNVQIYQVSTSTNSCKSWIFHTITCQGGSSTKCCTSSLCYYDAVTVMINTELQWAVERSSSWAINWKICWQLDTAWQKNINFSRVTLSLFRFPIYTYLICDCWTHTFEWLPLCRGRNFLSAWKLLLSLPSFITLCFFTLYH